MEKTSQITISLREGKTLEDLFRVISYHIQEDSSNNLEIGDFKRFQFYYRNINKQYRKFEIPKKSGGVREICAPDPYLLFIQRNLSDILKLFYIPGEYCHGFIPERSIVTNAELHTNKNYVLNVDLENFFPTIKFKRIQKHLEQPPFLFSTEMALMISRFTTKSGKLPQGAATSPLISNIVCRELDSKLGEFAQKYKQQYTRYADDITFSGYRRIYDVEFFNELNSIIGNEGFWLKKSKTRIQSKNKRQEVTGVVVNEKLNVNRKYVRELRAMIHQYKLGNKPDNAEAVISGKLEFIRMVKGKDRVYRNLISRFKE